METLRRFKVFESIDPDEALAKLASLFGDQRASINRLTSTPSFTSLSIAQISSSFLCHLRATGEIVFERQGDKSLINVNTLRNGRIQVMLGQHREFTSPRVLGHILAQDARMTAVLSDYDGLSFGIPRSAIRENLESLTGKTAVAPIQFDTVIDVSSNGGSMLRGAVEMAARQLGEPQSPLGHPAVATRLEEFIINALLHGQPHNYSDAIAGEQRTATPKQVRRAEAYIQAHAGETIRLAQIAEAAGCSVRALQLAFRAFRDTMTMLRQARLALAHAELARSDPGATTVTEIAVKFGFYNLGRFAQDYKKSFGQSPSETLRLTAGRQRRTGGVPDIRAPAPGI
jgi:AraC-like DNA-binding protein